MDMFVAIRSKDAEVSFTANEQWGAATTSNHNNNPKTGTKKGGRIVVSDDVCAICYVQDVIVSPDEM